MILQPVVPHAWLSSIHGVVLRQFKQIAFWFVSAVNVAVKEQTDVLHVVNDNIKELVNFMVSATEKNGQSCLSLC